MVDDDKEQETLRRIEEEGGHWEPVTRVSLAHEALDSLDQGGDFNSWVTVGLALVEGRYNAMSEAKANQPVGSAYNKAFGNWLIETKLGDG